MTLLILFAFIAGFVTILSPCILPILPVVLSGSVSHGKQRPLGIVAGFVTSFTFFTLFLSTIVQATGISADSLRLFSVITIGLLGLTLIFPAAQAQIEKIFTFFTRFGPKSNKDTGFVGGLITGLSLGLIWTPCVGPILASVISLAIVGEVSSSAAIITLAYASGTAIPMLLITYSGQRLFQRIPWLLSRLAKIQQVFGFLMILTALAIYFNLDRRFQTFILDTFPSYGTGLTKFEDNQLIQDQLQRLQGSSSEFSGRTTFEANPDNFPEAPEIIPSGEWFNSEPLTLAELEGKVVLLDFWTYSCINCIRTLPYLRSWHEKYADQGLVILGAHAPEFEFEKSASNLQEAIDDFELKYPIFQDNEFKTWRAYENRYWPAKYLIDKNGRIRYTHFGEGKYDETEAMIQELLQETGAQVQSEIANPDYQLTSRTPELYLGYKRVEYLLTESLDKDSLKTYSFPQNIPTDYFAFDGSWLLSGEYAQPQTGSKLKLSFEAKDVYLVMTTADSSEAAVEVLLDGQPLSQTNTGGDIDESQVVVQKDRLYHLISLPESGVHELELSFSSDQIQVFAFTFG